MEGVTQLADALVAAIGARTPLAEGRETPLCDLDTESSISAATAYLAAEENSVEKHEWIGGQIFAMSGGTPEHAALAYAIGGALRNALEGKPCRGYSSDLRIRVEETDFSGYPDVTLICGRLETSVRDERAATNPIVVVEVLSDSTEAYDRGEKFAHYRHIASLREYVLVSQRSPLIEIHRKNDAGRWELFEYGAGQRAELASVGVSISVDEVYRDPLAR